MLEKRAAQLHVGAITPPSFYLNARSDDLAPTSTQKEEQDDHDQDERETTGLRLGQEVAKITHGETLLYFCALSAD